MNSFECINNIEKLNTVAYNENPQIQAFTSFYSMEPSWFIKTSNRLFSIDKDNCIRLHHSKQQMDKSYIQFCVNKNIDTTKSFDNVEYSCEFEGGNHNFSRIWFNTNTMTSRFVDFIDKREDTYKFAIPRENSKYYDLGYANRMKGKYLICNYVFDHPGRYFRLPYIKTKFRTTYI